MRKHLFICLLTGIVLIAFSSRGEEAEQVCRIGIDQYWQPLWLRSKSECLVTCKEILEFINAKAGVCELKKKKIFSAGEASSSGSKQGRCESVFPDGEIGTSETTEKACPISCWGLWRQNGKLPWEKHFGSFICRWNGKTLFSKRSFCEKDKQISIRNLPLIGIVEFNTMVNEWQYREIGLKYDQDWESPIPPKTGYCKSGLPQDYNLQVTFDSKIIGTFKVHRKSSEPESKDSEVIGGALNFKLRELGSPPVLSDIRYRPYVVTSNSNFKDPSQWQVTRPPQDKVKIARNWFRKRFQGTEGNSLKVSKAYKNNKNDYLIGIVSNVVKRKQDEEFPELGSTDVPQWYFLPAKGMAQRLISDGFYTKEEPDRGYDALLPIDAGDYDGDGMSEFVFGVESLNAHSEPNGRIDYFKIFPLEQTD